MIEAGTFRCPSCIKRAREVIGEDRDLSFRWTVDCDWTKRSIKLTQEVKITGESGKPLANFKYKWRMVEGDNPRIGMLAVDDNMTFLRGIVHEQRCEEIKAKFTQWIVTCDHRKNMIEFVVPVFGTGVYGVPMPNHSRTEL